MNFICSVTSRFPENYRIGIEAGIWGVEEKYATRIRRATPGDLLIFALGGEFRSIHKIESEPFFDNDPLWPEKDGSSFPHRVRISEPLYMGSAQISNLAESISFMQGKRWTGTLQGMNGVFNHRATDADVSLIQSKLARAKTTARYVQRRQLGALKGTRRPRATMELDEAYLRSQLSELLKQDEMEIDSTATVAVNDFVGPGSRVLSGVYGAQTGILTAVDFHMDEPDANSLLDLLRRMAWLRQNMSTATDIAGLLLLKDPDPDLLEIAGEIPNVMARTYEVRIAFAPPPRPQQQRPSNAA